MTIQSWYYMKEQNPKQLFEEAIKEANLEGIVQAFKKIVYFPSDSDQNKVEKIIYKAIQEGKVAQVRLVKQDLGLHLSFRGIY